MNRITKILKKPFFSDYRTLLWLWILIAVISWILKYHKYNNFLIFRGVFWHTVNGTSLYAEYPQEYFDTNHYGPFFSIIIAPFAVMPEPLGHLLWLVGLTLTLWLAIRHSLLTKYQQIFIFWFCAETLQTALFMQQFNIAIASIIVAAFFLMEKKKDFWAALLIVIGTFVKLYGIVGLAFFFFSKQKSKFLLYLLFWSVIAFVLPMIISSPQYVIEQYHGWYVSLSEKNVSNLTLFSMQNISALGMFNRLLGRNDYSNLYILIPALIMFCMPYLRIKQWKSMAFRQMFLVSTLLFVVLFSTGSESSSYIIAIVGACIWYTASPWKRSKWDIALMVAVMLISNFGSTDLYPHVIRKELIQRYSLKALPCLIVWLKLLYEMSFRQWNEINSAE